MNKQEEAYYLDFLLGLTALVLLFPLMLVIAAVVGLTGPIFYRQCRVGKDGFTFDIIKFRTMVTDAEQSSGPMLSFKGDPRVTKLGSFLRKSHLDELPQLINVVRGEMAIVGPRPERPEFTKQYEEKIPHYKFRHCVRPGITGLAQVRLPYDATASKKIKYDLFYIHNRDSLSLNAKIVFATALKMVGITPIADMEPLRKAS